MPHFAAALVQWYQAHQRDLPWRHTQDPYLIWLSEVILQQTRVAQGLPYYQRFVEAYPTVAHLAQAPEQEVLRRWQGLGYYSRARNLHYTAQLVVRDWGGQFPTRYADLRQLKGIGPYTAAAVASFSANEAVAVVDGNVYRVLARVFGLEADIATPKGQRAFAELAAELLPVGQPSSTYNQAIMEFGALHCKPAAPECPTCPVRESCVAFASKRQGALPVKSKKLKIKQREFSYLVFVYQGRWLLRSRPAGDIWQGLYDFALVEDPDEAPAAWQAVLATAQAHPLLNLEGPQAVADFPLRLVQVSGVYRHVLTHQHLAVRFLEVEVLAPGLAAELAQVAGGEWFTAAQVHQLPKPILIANYLQERGVE
ncbi:MAG: A/G-specific adenine glycosylase [Bernardetiaceae bacterium]|jgi:A/G-specific adenine glycosylase|nr:A/G-specific adenine glycosylase [Bernardetiaceae bacterium]